MISEALELSVEGGRVSHCWCMCEIGPGYGGDRDGDSGWYTCGTKLGGVVHILEDAGLLSECNVKTLMTSDLIAFQVCSSGYVRAGIGRSSWKGLDTGRHEKTPVRCPCSRLATLHGALRTHGCRKSLPVSTLHHDICPPLSHSSTFAGHVMVNGQQVYFLKLLTS